jgi:hypothetical protein
MASYNPENTEILAKHFGLDAKELVRIIHFTDSFIAGGAVLGMLLENKPWQNSDLDIFYTSSSTCEDPLCFSDHKSNDDSNLKIIERFLRNSGYCRTTLWSSSTAGPLGRKTPDIEYKKSVLKEYVMNIETYFNSDIPGICKRRVQIITLHPCNKVEFLNAFDLNICKVALVPKQDSYDLCYLHEYVDTINNFQHEYELIQKRKLYVSFPAYPPNLEDRLIKYLTRGFTWIKSSTDQTVIMDDFDTRKKEDLKLLRDTIANQYGCNVLTYRDFICDYLPKFIDEPTDWKKDVKDHDIVSDIISIDSDDDDEHTQIPLKYEATHSVTTADKTPLLKYGAGYRYPIEYDVDRKSYVLKTIQGYINNFDNCPNKFFRILEGYKMFQFMLAELDFINSDKFCGHKKFIIVSYKKALEFQQIITPDYLAELSSNERHIIQDFTKVLEVFICKVSTVKISMGELNKYLG